MKKYNNIKIREAIKNSTVYYWQVAKKLRITDSNFSRLLRDELCDEDKNKLFNIIEEIKMEK